MRDAVRSVHAYSSTPLSIVTTLAFAWRFLPWTDRVSPIQVNMQCYVEDKERRPAQGGPPHFEDTHQIEPKAERYAKHGCDHRLPVRDARRCADSVLEVAEIAAR